MNIGRKLTRVYFDLVYNRLYDFTTGRLAPYRRLQHTCISKFEFRDGDSILCAGVGTGNEIVNILEKNNRVSITGIDSSDAALRRAYQKALRRGIEIKVLLMDAQSLEFSAESFDKALCIHVMDFIEDKHKSTAEILRVLKKGGQYVITYPSAKEGVDLGVNLIKDSIRHSGERRRLKRILSGMWAALSGAVVYTPLMLRPGQESLSRGDLDKLFLASVTNLEVEEYPVYSDFIVYGRK